MNYLYRQTLLALFCLATGGAALNAQWDPQGDARLFTYVFNYPGRYVNDHCLIRVDSLWHLYYIDGEIAGYWARDGNEVRIGHATSPDLLTWTRRDSALGIGDSGSLDWAHVYAPSVIERNGVYHMFYTGNEVSYSDGEHLFLATSTNLDSFTRYRTTPIFLPDRSWAAYHRDDHTNSSGGPLAGRDPFVIHDERYGYICYFVGRIRSSNPEAADSGYSCIAAATSPDLINWTDRGPLLIRKTLEPELGTIWNHPESPCLVRRGDKYYLFWKGGVGTRYVMSDDPLDFTGAEEHRLATSHASKIFEWRNKWYITSCSRDVTDITHTFTDRTRGLYLASLVWEGDRARVAVLDTTADTTSRVAMTSERPASATISPNPVRRGTVVSIGLPAGSSAGEYDLNIIDMRSASVIRMRSMAVVEQDGSRSVDLPTEGLVSGVYLVRIGTSVARLVVL